MTDKDIKDYCKNCDVEPPAMKFKCPECEHNTENENFAKDINVPRKEQIIIDGVDVSGCKFFNDITESYYCFGIPCKDRPNCYFKQLARKTQELEQYKASKQASYEALQKQCNELELKNRQLKQECEALKSESFTCEELITIQEKDIDRYLKALKEIEEYVRDNSDFDKSDILTSKTGAYDILNIINKAKGE